MITTTERRSGYKPLVSVAMLTYNHEPFIARAIQAVLDQQVDFEVELVIGEDCSTDDTRKIVFDLQAQHPDRIRLLTSERNVGAIANWKRVFPACRGKYLAFCEGDDEWNDRGKLALQVALLEQGKDYAMVHSHAHRYYVGKRRLEKNSLTVPEGLDDARAYEDILVDRRIPLTVTVVARRDLVEWCNTNCPECTDPQWPMGDTQLWLELSRLGKVGCIHKPLATTNVLLESAGQSNDPGKRLRFFLAVRGLKLHYLKKYPVKPEIDRAVRRQLAWSLLQSAYQARDGAVADVMFADWVENGGQAGLSARWLRWGSQSTLRHRLVYPYLRAETRWRRLRKRLMSVGSSRNAIRLW